MARLKETIPEIKLTDLKGKSLDEVRKDLEKIKFNTGLTVLALQAGVGKTHSFLQYCEDNKDKNIAYFAPYHSLLDEVETKLKVKLPSSNIIHWYGKSYKCKYKEYPDKKALLDHGLDLYSSCNFCSDKSECNYKNHGTQFEYNEPAIVLAPLEYIKSFAHKFDIIFVDEVATKSYNYSLPNEKDLECVLKLLGVSPLDKFKNVATNPELLRNIDLSELDRIFQAGLDKSLTDIENYKLIAKVWGCFKTSADFLKWRDIYKESDGYERSLKTYSEPFIYKIFELAQSRPVIIMDATFNKELFEDLLSAYDGEFGIETEFNINMYYSHVENKNSVIYRINPIAWYPKSSIRGNNKILDQVKELYNHYTKLGKQIGVITFKEIEKDNFNGFDTLHYNNLRGKNGFEKYDALIILGTYNPNIKGVMDTHNELYLTDLKEYEQIYYVVVNGVIGPKIRKEADNSIQDLADYYESVYLFTWDLDIKKHGVLIEYLKQYIDPVDEKRNHDVEWLDTAKIKKTDSQNIIIFDDEHTISLKLYKEKVKLTREDRRTYYFKAVKDEDTYLISYQRTRAPDKRQLLRTIKHRTGEIEETIKSDLIEELLRENELIQAIYRIRPLSDPKTIYVWGIVPDEVKKYMEYKEIGSIDPIITKLKGELIDSYNPERHFIENRLISEIDKAISEELGCVTSTAGKIREKYLSGSSEWDKKKDESKIGKKPFILVRRADSLGNAN